MKQTEIGMIPDDWEVKNIFKNCTIKARIGWQGLKSTEYLKVGDYLLITGTDFCNGFINWKSCSYVTEWRFKQDRNIQIQDGDVLITKDGTIGKVAFIPRVPLSGTLNSGVFVVRPKDKTVIDVVFLSLVFKSFWFGNFLEQITSGSTIVHLYQKDFVKFNFPLPPTLAEQQKIAKALSDVDNVISTLEKLITKKKNLKQGSMQQLLTGKKRLPGFGPALVEPVETTKFKLTEIGEIPEDWEVKELGEVAKNFTGLTYSPENINEYGTLVLRSSNIQNDMLAFEDNVYVNMNIPERAIAHTGDILICVRNGSKRLIGKSALITESANNCAFGAFMTILRTELLNQQFLFYVWQSDLIQKQIEESMGATINQITNKDIRHYLIAYPKSNTEQTAIANVLSSMDKEIEALNTKLEKYRNLKTGMMQQLLTGKIRLG